MYYFILKNQTKILQKNVTHKDTYTAIGDQ